MTPEQKAERAHLLRIDNPATIEELRAVLVEVFDALDAFDIDADEWHVSAQTIDVQELHAKVRDVLGLNQLVAKDFSD